MASVGYSNLFLACSIIPPSFSPPASASTFPASSSLLFANSVIFQAISRAMVKRDYSSESIGFEVEGYRLDNS